MNVANLGTVPRLPEEAVVEVPCNVDADRIHPRPVMPFAGHMLGLVQSVKAVEQTDDPAAVEHSANLAWEAFSRYPLVGSVRLGRQLLDGYPARVPGVATTLD